MSAVKNDLPLQELRKAAGKVAPEARRRAFESGESVSYIKDGKIVRESADGVVRVVGSSTAREIVVNKRVWKLA